MVENDPQTGQETIDRVWAGTYNTTGGYWEPNFDGSFYSIDAMVTLDIGETLTVTVSDTFDGQVCEYYDTDVFTKNGNTYTYTNNRNGNTFNFHIFNSTVAFTATFTVSRITEWKPIDGQTTATYTGDPYTLTACVISFEDGKYVLTSNTIAPANYWITQQPTTEKPTVAVNAPDKVKGYQWYSYKEIAGTFTVVEQSALKDTTSEIPVKVLTAAEYQAPSYDDRMDILATKQNLVAGQPLGKGVWKPLYGGNYELNYDVFVSKGGNLTFEITANDDILAMLDPTDPQRDEVSDFYHLMVFAVTLENKDINNINPTLVQSDANGVYTFPDCDLVSINFSSGYDGFTVKPVLDTTVPILEKVDGQTAATFTGDVGTYRAEVTMEDGTVLRSNLVDIKANNPNTNDAILPMIWISVISLCIGSVLLICGKRKKA